MAYKVKGWYNLPEEVNKAVQSVEDEIYAVSEEMVQAAAAVTNISGSALPVVPSLADVAAVKTYLDSLRPAANTRIDNIELKINDLLAKLRASGAIAE